MTDRTQQPGPVPHEELLAAHEGGKLSVVSRSPLATRRDLSIASTPGAAEVSRAVHRGPAMAAIQTWAGRRVAVVSGGSAVLGLGDIGPAASLPVMEGEAALFKAFADPDVPVMHDDQHGTAAVVLAALLNAATVVGKDPAGSKVVIAGAGAAGIAITEILLAQGIADVVLMDSRGVVSRERDDLNAIKAGCAARTNPRGLIGGPKDALEGADVFVGVSGGRIPEEHLIELASGAIVFAPAHPDSEILPEVAAKYASVVATGCSDVPNQINNVLAFPGIFRGALHAGATRITAEMKPEAAKAVAAIAVSDGPRAQHIVPSALVTPAVAAAVARSALESTGN